MTRLVCFNINGIRARIHQLEAIKDIIAPCVIGLQETKVDDEKFPVQAMQALGYHAEFFGQKSHYGVALLSTQPPLFVQKGFPDDDEDAQKRFIHARYVFDGVEVDVLNGYFPQGESRDHPIKFPMKRDYYANLTAYIASLVAEGRRLVVMGDMNVAPTDLDVGLPEASVKRWLKRGSTSFLPEERAWYETLMQQPLVDTYRHLYPNSCDQMSWFDYRSRAFEAEPKRGLRIDHILCSPCLAQVCTHAGISYEIRGMQKPSDHAPIWAAFDMNNHSS